VSTYTPTRITHQTLTISTVDTVTFGAGVSAVEVYNRDATGVIYARVDGTNPVVGADENYIIGTALVIPFAGSESAATGGDDVVKLISSTACAYSVTGI
jgi:hypothetical protein